MSRYTPKKKENSKKNTRNYHLNVVKLAVHVVVCCFLFYVNYRFSERNIVLILYEAKWLLDDYNDIKFCLIRVQKKNRKKNNYKHSQTIQSEQEIHKQQ